MNSPGPWKWVPFVNWDGGLQAADGSYVISNDEVDNTPDNAADARLIAAAPELLEALKAVLVWRDMFTAEEAETYRRAKSLIARIDATPAPSPSEGK